MKLKQKNWWLITAVDVMLFASATRISGDFWPRIMTTHYTYGAILWIIATLFWAVLYHSKGVHQGSGIETGARFC